MKTVIVEPVAIADKSVLRNLISLYLHDFSGMVPIPISDSGLFEYSYLDHYWTDSNRHAYFIKADGQLAGFVMIRSGDDISTAHLISEFFVLRGYRRQGIGKAAAHLAFCMFAGQWRVHEFAENTAAQAFWKSTINEYTNGQFVEEWSAQENRLVQTFVSPE